MGWHGLLLRLRALRNRRHAESELDEEVGFHLEMEARKNEASGMEPAEARRRARVAFNGVERVREECRDVHRFTLVANLAQDIRFGARVLGKNPGFAAVAALTLALGIGVNTTIFCAMNALVLRPLRLHEPERLVMIREAHQSGGTREPTMASSTEWRKFTRTLESIERGAFSGGPDTLTGLGRAERVNIAHCTPGYLAMLGVKPMLGRTFMEDDARPKVTIATVISAELWQRAFGADPQILGKAVQVGGKPQIVVGVLPPGFSMTPYDMRVDAWLAVLRNSLPETRWMPVVGRLKPGVSAEQAQAELTGFAQGQPGWDRKWNVRVEELQHALLGGQAWRAFVPLFGAVGFVLLIACANVANLLMARAAVRRKEIAIRLSLGAGRWRLVRQLLAESTLLALAGGALGVVVGVLGNRLLLALWPTRSGRPAELTLDLTVLGFTLALALLTGILFGLVPALRASRPDLHGTLKEGGREATGTSGHRTQAVLLVVETALAMVLLVGAGLLVRNFLRVQKVELGFNPRNVLTGDVLLAGSRYLTIPGGLMKHVTPQGEIFWEQAMDKIRRIPGVQAVGISHRAPPGYVFPRTFRILGQSGEKAAQENFALFNEVGGAFFQSLEIPLVRGRFINDEDRATSPWVVNINQEFVKQYFPKEDPLGKMVHFRILVHTANVTLQEDHPREIVGVVADVRHYGPNARPMPVAYASYHQHARTYPGGVYTGHLWKSFTVRTSGDPLKIAGSLQKVVAEVDKDQPMFDIQSLEQKLSDYMSAGNFPMQLFGIFAAIALSLAAVGIYGVMSYLVTQRTHEIGIRVALGARGADVLRMVIGRGVLITVIGLVAGIGGSLVLTRVIGRMLFGVVPTDLLTYGVVSLVLLAVALAASWLPARRALKVDPLLALRHE